MTEQTKDKKPEANEEGSVKMTGHLLIRDKETGEVLVDKDNAIHHGNMALVIANALSYYTTSNSGIYYMAFGNGGSDVLSTGEIKYKNTNTSSVQEESAQLYNRTYQKIVAKAVESDAKNNIQVISTSSDYTDLKITCTLDFGEPSGQMASDTASGNDNPANADTTYVFDELGLYSFNAPQGQADVKSARLLTHVIFHPVQKSMNRVVEIVYTIRIQMQ